MPKQIICAIALAALSLAAQAQNLVKNGDLNLSVAGSESIAYGDLTDWTHVTTTYNTSGFFSAVFASAADSVKSSTTGAVNGIAHSSKLWLWQTPQVTESPAGGSFVAIDADKLYTSAIAQTITGLTAGTTYKLTFWYAGGQFTAQSGSTNSWWDVSFGGSTQRTDILQNASQGFTGWHAASMSFVADGPSAVLSFLAGSTSSGAPPVSLLDGVSLTAAVPEPSSFAFALAGLVLLGGLRLRARRQGQS